MRLTCAITFGFSLLFGPAPAQQADSVVVPLGQSSRIIFTMEDRRDLEVLRHYDFQHLFNDIFDKLEGKDSTAMVQVDTLNGDNTASRNEDPTNDEPERWDSESKHMDDDDWDERNRERSTIGRTWHSYNIDLGTNNYLADDQFPGGNEPHAIRPWGSWYLAGNSVQRTKLGRHLFAEWSLGVSWYSFKFQDDNISPTQDELGVHFIADSRDVDFIKSKLSATFINASLVPVLDFGGHSRKRRIWNNDEGGFRFGIGPYVGYRVSSKAKLVFEQDGDRKKEKNRDNFHLNNLRYGFRVQIGVRSTDLFINYDMNELFAPEKGPKLNAVSFGLIL